MLQIKTQFSTNYPNNLPPTGGAFIREQYEYEQGQPQQCRTKIAVNPPQIEVTVILCVSRSTCSGRGGDDWCYGVDKWRCCTGILHHHFCYSYCYSWWFCCWCCCRTICRLHFCRWFIFLLIFYTFIFSYLHINTLRHTHNTIDHNIAGSHINKKHRSQHWHTLYLCVACK